jgi:hypothetical protein
MSAASLPHVEHFVKNIGPRGSTTEQERQALNYCQDTLEALGFSVERDTYNAPLSGWHPYALALGSLLLAILIFVVTGRGPNFGAGALAASVLGLVTMVSFFLQSLQRNNPLPWFLPVAPSQNVWCQAPARGEARQYIVLTGHVDTHRQALAMQSPLLWRVFQILTTLVGAAGAALVGIFILGIFTPEPLLRTVALILGVFPLIGLVFTLQPDLSPYVTGANDNATGAAAVLAFAERLRREPLEHTAVYLVNTGCEEVGCAGVAAWIRQHAEDAPGASYLVLDNIGGKGSDLNYVREEIVLLSVKAEPGLLALAEQVASEQPDLNARPFSYRGLFSELTVCRQRGQKALGLLNFDPKTGMPPRFHTVHDDLDNIDPALLERSERFAWAIMQKIDARANHD